MDGAFHKDDNANHFVKENTLVHGEVSSDSG